MSLSNILRQSIAVSDSRSDEDWSAILTIGKNYELRLSFGAQESEYMEVVIQLDRETSSSLGVGP